ncbi:MAG: UspA domain protein [Thermoleophilia bacterium]|nr:UspA domain protein [Thermoleophilia bacterium]
MTTSSILICFDGSAAADEAIARTAALHPGADVVVLTAWAPSDAYLVSWSVMAVGVGPDDGDVEASALAMATTGAIRARAAGLRATAATTRARGSIAEAIRAWAVRSGSSLVVVGSTGSSALADTLFGSVASAVVHHSSVPVLVVPSQALHPRAASPAVADRDVTEPA